MSIYEEYQFRLGKLFRQKQPARIEEYLETAERTHEFLQDYQVETEDGLYWKNSDEKSADLGYYIGTAGIMYFYLELYKITQKGIYRDITLKAADYLNKHWQDQEPISRSSLEGLDVEGMESSIYVGTSSIAMCLYPVYQEFNRAVELETIRAITNQVIAASKKEENGVHWSYDQSMLFDGGIVVYLYKIYDLLKEPEILEVANQGINAILAKAIRDERGGLAWTSYAHAGVTRVPNFECGTAGIGFALTVAYEQTKNQEYLDAAIEAAKHLRAIAIPQGDGFLVPWHDDPKEKEIFYVSTCHGPGGTSKLFYQLYKLTGDESYLEDIKGYYRGLRHIGVPEKQSAGYWNTVCLCCGTAGVLQFLINYILITGDESAKRQAVISGNILLGEQERQSKGGVAWPLAFTRVRPEIITKDVGYGVGTAGVAGALLQLYLYLKDDFKWDRLFDDPFPIVLS